jgi:hypothetical protein
VSYQAGSAFVSVKPDMSTFQDDIRAELAKTPDVAVKVSADTAQLSADLDAVTRDRTATVNADADTAAATAKLDEAAKTRTAKINVVETLQKGGTLQGLGLPGLAALGGVALGPQAVGLAAGVSGLGAAFAAAGGEAAAFGAIAKPMFTDVTAAQKAFTKAQDAYNKATTSADRAKALQAEQQALAKLTPAEKDLYTQLTALEGAWKKLSQAEQPVVESALAPWLQTATSGMQLLKPLIEDGAGAIRLLGTEAKSALADPFWGTFFNTLGTTGQIALVNFGEAAGKVADGVAHLFVAFAPDIDKLPPLVNDLAGAFDKWSKSVTSTGLDNFLSKTFSPDNVKALAADGKDLATFVENIAKASADMSPLAFGGISNVLTILGSLPPGVIEAATGLFLAIKTIGTISAGVSAVTGILDKVKGLGGGAAATAESAAEGTTAGEAGGAAAATAFTTAFTTGVTTGLAEAFAAIDTESATEAAAAGTAMGTAAATSFAASFGTESATALTAVFAGEDIAGAAEAAAGGAALGTAFATGFGGSLTAIGTAVAAAIPEAGLVAVLAAGLAGSALGTAFGLGFTLGFGATGAKSVVSSLQTDLTSSAASASTWLQPAGAATVQGYVAGFVGQQAGVVALGAQLKGWVQQGTAGSNTWLTPPGQQTGHGFSDGIASTRAEVNSTAAGMKNWVTDHFQPAGAWLTNAGISIVQGLANGILAEASVAVSAAQSLANAVTSTVNNALQVHSPSRVMHQIGVFTGQGLGLGILSQEPFVGQAAGTLAMASVQGLAGIASAQSLSALGSLGVPSIGSPASLPGVSSPLRAGGLQLQLSWAGSSDQVTNAIVGGLQGHIVGATGGDVQAALGHGPVRIS